MEKNVYLCTVKTALFMTKKLLSLLLAALMAHGFASAQSTSFSVPYGSFEQWTSHSGYSVTALFIPISVYSSFSTPTGWDYLSYPVNETMTVSGFNINVNTDIPLIKASQETGSVPDGSKAVKLETFMLSDIISSTVYSVASGSLDTTLTNTVYPSILSTGAVDIDHFIPLMNTFMGNMDSLETLLSTFAALDVNYYFDGGIALGDFVPSRLTGSYKYHSAVGGDNGGVLLLGTRYNSTLGRREVVGGGANIALADTASYAPFTVGYMSLYDIDTTYPLQTPDSLIIMLVSSASLDRQQGSWLCVDNLALWHDPCASVTGFAAAPDIHEAVIAWNATGSVNGYELEYGTAGFALGNGTLLTVAGGSCSFSGLAANTQYDVYIRTMCNNGIRGDWASFSFTTLQDSCASILTLSAEPDIHEAVVSWSASSDPDGFEVLYCPTGENPFDGIWQPVGGNSHTLTGLEANTLYDVYVRSVCGSVYGNWAGAQFLTLPDTCARILSVAVDSSAASLTPDSLVFGYVAAWTSSFEPQAWEVEYGLQGSDLTALTDSSSTLSLPPLLPDSRYELRVRALCADSIYGDWLSTEFHTMGLEIIDTTTTDTTTQAITQLSNQTITVSPNPASGYCVVDIPCKAELNLYASDGRLLQTVVCFGSPVTLQLPSRGVFLLQVVTPSGTLTRKIVNR